MPPTTEEPRIQTSAGMESANETVSRISNTLSSAPPTANNIPMSSLATQTESLTMPTPNVPQVDVQGTLSAGRQVAEDFAKGEETKALQAGQKYSQSEQNIREAFGILGTESATRTQMEEQAGVNDYTQDVRKFQEQLRRNLADLDQFDVDNVNTIEQMRVDASKRDITKRTFNAMSAEAGIQQAVQRANMVAQTRATIAAIDVTQGNLEAATTQVDKALKSIYDPIKMGLQMETQFLQNNLSLFTTAQNNSANARIKAMEQEIKEIDRATMNVDAAVSTGFASASDIEAMMALAGNPEEQNKYAMNIIGLAARAEVAERQAAIQARIDAANQALLAEQGEAQNLLLQQLNATTQHTIEAVSAIDRITNNSLGINASTGVVQNALATGFAATTPFAPAAEGAGTLSRFIPGVGVAINTAAAAKQKQEILGDLTFLVNDVTFSTMRRLKESGVTFGALTEGERIAIGKSADALFSALKVDDSGTVIGINTSAEAFTKRLNEYRTKTLRFQDEANKVAGQINSADEALIRSF